MRQPRSYSVGYLASADWFYDFTVINVQIVYYDVCKGGEFNVDQICLDGSTTSLQRERFVHVTIC